MKARIVPREGNDMKPTAMNGIALIACLGIVACEGPAKESPPHLRAYMRSPSTAK